MRSHKTTDKEYKEEVGKYKKEVNRLANSYFRIIDIPK
jgi:HAMP domain-containing protein